MQVATLFWLAALTVLPLTGPAVPRDGQAQVGSLCEGQGFVEIDKKDGRSIGKLTCSGDCPDRTPCRPQTNADKSREWCGCPGEEEPTDCHLVKVKLRRGDWAWDCHGPCPQPQDMCTPQARRAGPKRLVVSCECRTPDGK
jgi:hypothetical protein